MGLNQAILNAPGEVNKEVIAKNSQIGNPRPHN